MNRLSCLRKGFHSKVRKTSDEHKKTFFSLCDSKRLCEKFFFAYRYNFRLAKRNSIRTFKCSLLTSYSSFIGRYTVNNHIYNLQELPLTYSPAFTSFPESIIIHYQIKTHSAQLRFLVERSAFLDNIIALNSYLRCTRIFQIWLIRYHSLMGISQLSLRNCNQSGEFVQYIIISFNVYKNSYHPFIELMMIAGIVQFHLCKTSKVRLFAL